MRRVGRLGFRLNPPAHWTGHLPSMSHSGVDEISGIKQVNALSKGDGRNEDTADGSVEVLTLCLGRTQSQLDLHRKRGSAKDIRQCGEPTPVGPVVTGIS